MHNLSNNLYDCIEFGFDELVCEFDAILESVMMTDIPRDQLREAISNWRDAVDLRVHIFEEEIASDIDARESIDEYISTNFGTEL